MANVFHEETMLVRYFRVIRYLNRPHSVYDLMDHFHIQKRTAYRILDNLQTAGVVMEKTTSTMWENGTVRYRVVSI